MKAGAASAFIACFARSKDTERRTQKAQAAIK
jgi:hypothetical protein